MLVKLMGLTFFGFISIFCLDESEELFTNVYRLGCWKNEETCSGSGSTIAQTTYLRGEIEKLIKDFEITSILDIPCGDFNWMKLVDIDNCYYIGADIVKPMIETNNKLYSNININFRKFNAIKDNLPKVDIIICRDLFVHMPIKAIKKVLQNFKKSGSTYLLATTFINTNFNNDINFGDWRPINLQMPPFSLQPPILVINENCTENNGMYKDKSLGLWKIKDLVLNF